MVCRALYPSSTGTLGEWGTPVLRPCIFHHPAYTWEDIVISLPVLWNQLTAVAGVCTMMYTGHGGEHSFWNLSHVHVHVSGIKH